ncbi:hypothetical protein HMPREF0972_00866 [Actinomyces sp. oral taxon 848 str. F0332]|nr:hypothetical protein HMPREF0972_00866 [Actinomyces sp. oral taxon 848 str. F0332]
MCSQRRLHALHKEECGRRRRRAGNLVSSTPCTRMGEGPCLARPSFDGRLFQDEPTSSRRLADRLLRGDWTTGARGLADGSEAIGSEDL